MKRITLGALVVLVVLLSSASFAFGDLAFTVLGDWGKRISYTDVIAARSTQKNSQFTVAIGDNFYKVGEDTHGVTSVNDSKWTTIFENQFTQPFFQKRWYVIAGNHDYDGNEQAQIDYTKKSTRWYFPSFYYKFTRKASAGVTVDFIMIDSHVLANDNDELSSYDRKRDVKQLKWIAKTLKESKATWKIMFSHHPLYHNKGKNEWFVKNLVPLLEKYKVAAFVNGHMHSFQHLRSKKVHYFIVGNTAIQKGVKSYKTSSKGVSVKFLYPQKKEFKNCGDHDCKGFAIINVKSKAKMTLDYYNSKNTLKYTAAVKNPNRK